MLERLRCIQLDPLDVIGTNADLVVMARVDGVAPRRRLAAPLPAARVRAFREGALHPPGARVPVLPAQGHAAQTPWWRHGEREERVPPQLVAGGAGRDPRARARHRARAHRSRQRRADRLERLEGHGEGDRRWRWRSSGRAATIVVARPHRIGREALRRARARARQIARPMPHGAVRALGAARARRTPRASSRAPAARCGRCSARCAPRRSSTR